jgi:hypothetical protein
MQVFNLSQKSLSVPLLMSLERDVAKTFRQRQQVRASGKLRNERPKGARTRVSTRFPADALALTNSVVLSRSTHGSYLGLQIEELQGGGRSALS